MIDAGRRRAMAIRGFVCQNVAVGSAFGGFGIAVLPLQAQYGVSRGTATLGLALVVLAMGMAGPLSAALMARIGIRRTMLLGILISAAGYVMLAFAPSILVVLIAYALPIGMSVALFGSLPCAVLASNWFQPNPGRAIGFVSMPLLVALVPLVGLPVIEHAGLTVFFLCFAGLHILILPVAWGIVDRPAEMPAETAGIAPVPPGVAITARLLFRQPIFWVIVAGAGLLNAIAITGSAHLVALVREVGGSSTQASLTAGISGGASMVGSLLIGFFCDRIGAARSLMLLAIGFMLSWLAIYLIVAPLPVMAISLLIGLCGSGTFPAVNVLAGHLYGPQSLPRVIGLFGMLTLPLTFFLPPLAGVLHDAAGGYSLVAATIVAIGLAVAIIFYATARVSERRLRARGAANALA